MNLHAGAFGLLRGGPIRISPRFLRVVRRVGYACLAAQCAFVGLAYLAGWL